MSNSYHQPIVKLLKANAGARRMGEVFEDFVHMSALAFRNVVDRRDEEAWLAREKQYLDIAARYDGPARDRFAHALALALVTVAVEEEQRDVLGRLYMELDLGNERLGQFYTPYDVSLLIAAMNLGEITEAVEHKGWASLHEPACGAAGFIVAMAEQMRREGMNPQQQLHVMAEDIASIAVWMTYVHLSLLHIPGIVARRDTLTQETFEIWPAPAHVLGRWDLRLHTDLTNQRASKVLSISLRIRHSWVA